jgi:TnpA family transposase
LDFIQENTSDVQPDTIHADTQGQSAAIFGLAYLLGIQLQPRIRNWKNLHFFRPNPQVRYKHIDLLFTKQVEWDLIETMLPEMLRVALSIGAGRIKPSTILRRLATYSRKSKLYFAFRELGRVVRTAFLLDYNPISNSGEPSRRQPIKARPSISLFNGSRSAVAGSWRKTRETNSAK